MDKNTNQENYIKLIGDFIRDNFKTLLTVGLLALVASTIVAFALPPYYRSVATIIPSNSNRMSKAILAERYSSDFMDYGAERDCEYAIQILSSSSMEDSLINHFDLTTHYAYGTNDPYHETKTRKQLQHNMSVKRTNYMGVQIAVLDRDPVMAADMANFTAQYYDTLCHRIHNDRAHDAYTIMRQICDDLASDIKTLEDSLRKAPQYKESLKKLIDDKCAELAKMETRTSQAKVDMSQQIEYKFSIDQAKPADKKYKPKRALVIVGGTLSILAIYILMLALFVKRKDEE